MYPSKAYARKLSQRTVLVILGIILITLLALLYRLTAKPAMIRYGEFPFKLVYELNGNEVTIEDTVICEFGGMRFGSNGWWRKWEGHLASGKEVKFAQDYNAISLMLDTTNEVFFFLDSPRYYMGDVRNIATWIDITRAFIIVYDTE